MEAGGRRFGRVRGRLGPMLACSLVLLVLQADLVPRGLAVLASNLLQLVLAGAAAFACFRTAARERELGRWFFALTGLGLALWATAQALWTLTQPASSPKLLLAVGDLIFIGSTSPLVAACALRPHRPRRAAFGLAADVAFVSILALFVHAYFRLAYGALGAEDPYTSLAPAFSNPQRLMVLAGLLWLLRGSDGAWRRFYADLALAMVVFHGGGVLPNMALFVGAYRPGLQDVPWTLPFLWIALAAAEWQPQPAQAPLEIEPEASGLDAPVWSEARHGSILALGAVTLVPIVHQLASLLGSPDAPLAELRGRIALVGTLLVGGLYLARQLHTLRRAEATQQVREERFRALVENSADAIGVLDRTGRFGYLSASSERVTGYPPEQLVGSSPLELAHPDERDALGRTLAELSARAQGTARGYVRFRHRDGGFRDGVIEATNRLDLPAVGGVVLHVRDVTAQRRAELERERSLSLLEATLESTADGILVVDRQGRIERYNQRFAEMWRIPRELLEAHDDERAMALALGQLRAPAGFLEKVRQLYDLPAAESFDTLHFRDGRVFERYSLPQRLAAEPVGRVWSFRDVTARARAEEAMARIVAVIEATPDFVGTCDATLRTLYVNRAGRRMVGLAEAEPLTERHVAEFHPPGAAARLLDEAIPGALRDGAWSGESRLRHADGREIPVLQVVLAHRSQGGEVDFLSTIARDISQRIEAEQELRRSHTMAALGSLVAGVAHEVRSPLFGISSTLDAFEARFSRQEELGQYTRVFREQLERLSSLMNDLLEYAKPTRLELGRRHIEDVVAQAITACAPLAASADVSVSTRLADDLPALPMDERRLVQVLRNLVENAVQHSPRGGLVRLETRLLRGPDGERVECSVEDQGPGFDAAALQQAFEPFFTRRHGGTGLGLSIVHRIVSDHGGSVVARNAAAGGARVSVTLPTSPASGGAP